MDEPSPICRRVRENLAAYLDGELKPGTRRLIEEHLADCPRCRTHRDELRDTWRLLDDLEAPIVPRRFTEKVVAFVEDDEQAGLWGRLSRATGARGLAAGVAASIAAAVFLFGLYISSKPLSDVLTPAEQECVRYLDLLVDLQTAENMDTVKQMQSLGQTIEGDEDSEPAEIPDV